MGDEGPFHDLAALPHYPTGKILYHWIWGWAGLRAGLDVSERKPLATNGNRTPDQSSSKPTTLLRTPLIYWAQITYNLGHQSRGTTQGHEDPKENTMGCSWIPARRSSCYVGSLISCLRPNAHKTKQSLSAHVIKLLMSPNGDQSSVHKAEKWRLMVIKQMLNQSRD